MLCCQDGVKRLPKVLGHFVCAKYILFIFGGFYRRLTSKRQTEVYEEEEYECGNYLGTRIRAHREPVRL